MNEPATAREALIGEVAQLIQAVQTLAPILNESCWALQQANAGLRDELAGFEHRIAVIAEAARTQTVKHIAARAEEAARRSIDLQSRAMADAARVAFGAELVASRVEGLTSKYQVDLLTTEDIRRALDKSFRLRAMPPALVNGKTEPVQTYYVEPDVGAV